MYPIDIISTLYVAFGAWRGRAAGLAEEGYRLLRYGIALAAGCGLYGLVSDTLKRLLSLGGDVSGPVAFIGVIGGAWFLVRKIRGVVMRFLAARFADHARVGGAIAGGLRTLLIVISIAGVFALGERLPGRDQVAEKTIVGRLAAWILPGK